MFIAVLVLGLNLVGVGLFGIVEVLFGFQLSGQGSLGLLGVGSIAMVWGL